MAHVCDSTDRGRTHHPSIVCLAIPGFQVQQKRQIHMKPFTPDEINSHIALQLTGWTYTGSAITREFKFRNFVEAFSFMTSIALEAEKMDHHPDWSNAYNMVRISLNTHSAQGITQLDFDLARKIDDCFKKS
jgi:4a-hydroxytetrahydrobiopterin dehydratase